MNVQNAVRLMKDISAYGFQYLQDSHFRPSQMTNKQVMVMAYFTHAQAHYDGVLALVCKPKSQPATAHLQVRALQETWINVTLMTCVEEETWSNYLYIVSEEERLRTIRRMLDRKQISEADANKSSNEARAIIKELRKTTHLPDIKGVMYPSKSTRDFFGKDKLSLREMCQVIDHYRQQDENSSMTGNYDVVYKFLSQYTHQDARTVLSVVKETAGEYVWDIGGSPEDIAKVMSVAFSYYSGCLRTLTDLMGDTNSRRFTLFENRFDKYLR